MTRRILFVFIIGSCVLHTFAQEVKEGPRLVVGIVVDQMRMEYLYRYERNFGTGGFRRLMQEGFTLQNAHYNYAPTVTGPGHASIYTGTPPAIHGIIGNDFFDKRVRKMVNCVEDEAYPTVGAGEKKGGVAPTRLMASTITDELKLFTQHRAKVVGMSIKDRGAVLPAGHTPDGAYWYDSKTGRFVTSTYYREKLPPWVEKFNARNLADQYLNQTWNLLLPPAQYTASGPDASPYENKFQGKSSATFPYPLKELRSKNGNFDLLIYTPFANDLLTKFAIAALEAEKLGEDEITDFLSVSYSTPDILGHFVGPNAVELEDQYLRLDRNLEHLLQTLDARIGKGRYTVFLTADHAVADVPQYLKDLRIPAGNFSTENLRARLQDFLATYYPGKQIIDNISNEQIFLNPEAFSGEPRSSGVDVLVATELIGKFLQSVEGVYHYYPRATLLAGDFHEGGIKGRLIRGFYPARSGDIAFVLNPGWFSGTRVQGTTHATPWTYDTHIPILFFGHGIRQGSSAASYSITDIAPTLSVLLRIKFPNGSTGQPITEVLAR